MNYGGGKLITKSRSFQEDGYVESLYIHLQNGDFSRSMMISINLKLKSFSYFFQKLPSGILMILREDTIYINSMIVDINIKRR